MKAEKFSKCVSYTHKLRGRIGGNPPILIEDNIPHNYLFYATVVHPQREDLMISILIHEDFEVLIDNNIYPNVEVKVVEHVYSDQSLSDDKSIKDLCIHSISDYEKTMGQFFFVKAGGEPRYIQHKEYYYQALRNNGYSFLLQIDEDGYSDDLLIGSYPFNYGALYLYEHNVTKEVIAGFWQYS